MGYIEKTFVILKPDAVKRNLVGRILQRFEDAGMQITGLHTAETVGRDFWDDFYRDLESRIPQEKYLSQIKFMSSGRVVFLFLKGDDAIHRVRKLIGKTDPQEAAPGTIRGDFGSSLPETLIHASDSQESLERETELLRNWLRNWGILEVR